MRKTKLTLTLVAILLPLAMLTYKYFFLDMSLIPKTVSDLWRIELSVQSQNLENASDEIKEQLRLPIPKNTSSQFVRKIKVSPKIFNEQVSSGADSLLSPSSDWTKKNGELLVQADMKLIGSNVINKINSGDEFVKLNSNTIKKYTNLPDLSEETLKELQTISNSIIFETDSLMDKLEKIFFYVSDEFILQPKNNSLEDTIRLKSGSYLGQARFLAALAKVNSIPARISFGIQILKQDGKKTHKYTRIFYTEVFAKGNWLPINPHQKKFGTIEKDFVILHQDSESYADIFNNRDLLSIYTEPLVYKVFKSENYLEKLEQSHPFWSYLSLHKFSLSIQAIFFGILLIPFGTVILSFMRVMVGINTFGIFTPILLTLFFLETSLAFGLSFFLLVVLLGLGQRVLLDKFYILAVPRLSILLTLVIFMYVGFAVIVESYGLMSVSNNTLNYFPIVIITVFIERFSIYFIEEGASNTLKTTLGTFLVSFLCYLLLSVTWLKFLIFNNPELIILAIGINLLIGNYKGYRLLEFFRFYDFKGSTANA